MIYRDRVHAGQLLANAIEQRVEKKVLSTAVVIGLPRGGIVLADEIAQRLNLKLTAILIEKIRHPINPEYAVGAVGEKEIFLNPHEKIRADYLESQAILLRKKIKQRLVKYQLASATPAVVGQAVILVDDGVATGLSLKTAIAELRAHSPTKMIVALPVASPDSLQEISQLVDQTICLFQPEFFGAVGQFYLRFDQVEDEEVVKILAHYRKG